MSFTGPVTLSTGAIGINTTSGAAAGANISFSSTIDGAQALTLNAGTSGTVTFSGVIGGTTPLTGLTVTNALSTGLNNTITTSAEL